MFNKNQKASIIGLGFAASLLLIPDGGGFSDGNERTLANLYYGDPLVTGQIIDIRTNVLAVSNSVVFTYTTNTPELLACSDTKVFTNESKTPIIGLESLTRVVTVDSNTPKIQIIMRRV